MRPIGEYKVSAPTTNTRRKIARRTALVLAFLLSLSAGYLLCGHVLQGYSKTSSWGGAAKLEGGPAPARGGTSRNSARKDGSSKDRARSASSSTSTTSSAPATQRIHTLTTTNGSPYQNYQMRIAYASYKRMLAMPGGEHHVAFTRILHRTARDKDVLAREVPTFRAEPLQPECDDWCPYPVSDRANAVSQYWAHAKRKGILQDVDWVYMIESDYIFVKPLLPPTIDLDRNKTYGFYFHYIQPPFHVEDMEKLYDGPPGDVQSTGPAPLLMTVENWIKVTPIWEELTARIEADEGMKNRLGWVREMYAFSSALRIAGVTVILDSPGAASTTPVHFIRELPIHNDLEGAHALHYTLPTIINPADGGDEGGVVWSYDKREHTAEEEVLRVEKVDHLPEWPGEGRWKFIEGQPVTKPVYDLLVLMVSGFNAAIDSLEDLPGTTD